MTNQLHLYSSAALSRITLIVHQKLASKALNTLRDLGIDTLCIEHGRSVRQHIFPAFFGIPVQRIDLSDSPVEVFRLTVQRDSARALIRWLSKMLDLNSPGRGSAIAQDITGIDEAEPDKIVEALTSDDTVLTDLALIKVILSNAGSGDRLSRVALNLGAGVPYVGLGTGTGIRDRIGLLRITIPPEKELVRLIVPGHDAPALERLIIEEGHLDRPGGGFVYRTPVTCGVIDTLISIGRQGQAASIEQIIAAVDDLKRGTSWRKRFTSMEPEEGPKGPKKITYREISFIALADHADAMIHSAMNAGASGATTIRVSMQSLQDGSSAHSSRIRGLFCVPAKAEASVLSALIAGRSSDDKYWSLQTLDADGVFSYRKG